MLIHTPATRPPGTLAEPRMVKMEVLLPKVHVEESPAVAHAVSRIVQHFAEQVGVYAMRRFDDAANTAAWPKSGAVAPLNPCIQPIIPPSCTPRYTFYGRVPGELDDLIGSLVPGGTPIVPLIAAPVQPSTDPSHVRAALGRSTVTSPTPSASPAHPGLLTTRTPSRTARRQDAPEASTDIGALVHDGKGQGYVSSRGKPHIRVAHSPDEPYSAEEVIVWAEANYHSDDDHRLDIVRKGIVHYHNQRNPTKASHALAIDTLQRHVLELEHLHAEAEAQSVHQQDVIHVLSARIAELEKSNAAQEMDILALRMSLTPSLTGESLVLPSMAYCSSASRLCYSSNISRIH